MENKIKEIRQLRNMTAAKLAELCGTNAVQIYRMESGKRELSFDWLSKISKALNVKPYELIVDNDWNPEYFEVSNISDVSNFALAQNSNITFKAEKDSNSLDILEKQLLKIFNEMELDKKIALIYKLQNKEVPLE